jgi:uncharacterized PurR-regulated membrane protein YhhQ (DUF165 family)
VEAAEVANQHPDDYVLLTVLAASVLFFSGIGVKFQGRWIKIALNGFGALLLMGTVIVAATFLMTWVTRRSPGRRWRPFVPHGSSLRSDARAKTGRDDLS